MKNMPVRRGRPKKNFQKSGGIVDVQNSKTAKQAKSKQAQRR
jgi:hypothetical protein